MTGPSQRPDINNLYVIELPVGFETWIRINAGIKKRKIKEKNERKEIMSSYVDN